MSEFEKVSLSITDNTYLRDPQVEAYRKIERYFNTPSETRKEALIVLPTGTGKTGLIAIAPYAASKKRVLVVTPQTVIADTVMGSLDSGDYKNFWYTSGVIKDVRDLPSVIHYDKKITNGVLDIADFVVLNVHKLQERLESSLLKKVPSDFFDLIIIDEAHHSEAHTWKRAIEYFGEAGVLKLTGTPFRSDGVQIQGEEIYNYSLSKAMANGYVKSLEKFNYIPDQMFFTLDEDDKTYTLEELRALKIKDNEWVSRKVALAEESNLGVIRKSIEKLKSKRERTGNPHKIVAVACSIAHAEQLKTLYEDEGLKTALVHSDMEKELLKKEFLKIDTHNVEVVINVALLGEGYDHKFLSIAAIFRPFRSDLPYQQFIGRVLRSISLADAESIMEEDNIAQVVVHEELGLDPLWEAYKKEIMKKGMIKEIRAEKKRQDPRVSQDSTDDSIVTESEEHKTEEDTFINTDLLHMRKEKEKEDREKIRVIMDTLGVSPEEAKKIILSSNTRESKHALLRPDLLQADLRKEIDNRIREEIIPELLVANAIELQGEEIYNCMESIFPRGLQNLLRHYKKNGAILAIYFNAELKNKIGVARDQWEINDYYIAIDFLNNMVPFISQKLSAHI
ncbi:restriction endonuclease subunit R [Sporosarcina sp. P12(2017)]|uniref:DEAD/DEAH box helicase n=1 Tax=unclassified Sporosarcina TaxID=2647733 RepID=UPI000C16ADBD|nr:MULTISPECIES: DEAD/DEAH box helicase family protein [unclassified Sporosarcina]PIC59064.1 restriction endonuclease subunit R [Sporosarcina sp. P10]PIC62385.1 restriction endonuclease subunit R [Sporosarcina sp. P12(2017)]